MAALNRERDTKVHEIRHLDWLPVKAGTIIYAGAIVAIDATGYAVPAATGTDFIAAGRAEHTVDNRDGASGDRRLTIRRGIFLYANSAAGDALAITDRYKLAYMVDDQTVAKTDGGGTRSILGRVVRVEPAGVWIDIDPLARS